MSKYDQLLELLDSLLFLFKIEYDDDKRRLDDAKIILSSIQKDSISKIRDIILSEGLLCETDCMETKFFRYIIDNFCTGDEKCCQIIRILADKFLPQLAVVCPVSDFFLFDPYGYITSLPHESYPAIGMCFDKLNYVLKN